jgi:hypothetical protein
MFRFLGRRAGVLALSSLGFVFFSILAIQAFFPLLNRDAALIGVIVIMLVGIPAFLVLGGVFLYKSFVVANDSASVGGARLLGYFAGSTAVAVLFWYLMIGVGAATGLAPKDLTPEQGLTYVVEQMLSGMLLDIMEVYDLRLTDVTYAPGEYGFATLTLGMRLTGSFVVAAPLLKVFSSRAT